MGNHAKSGFFLLEMIISITFFALCSAICMNLFVQARVTSIRTREVNMALIAAQSAAESFKAANGMIEDTADYLGTDAAGSDIYVNYDENWQRTPFVAKYRLQLYINAGVSPVKAEIDVMSMDDGRMIHSLVVEKYKP